MFEKLKFWQADERERLVCRVLRAELIGARAEVGRLQRELESALRENAALRAEQGGDQ